MQQIWKHLISLLSTWSKKLKEKKNRTEKHKKICPTKYTLSWSDTIVKDSKNIWHHK